MITATFHRKNNHYFSYEVTGHSGYAEIGQDIVCAGISSLYITITEQLLSLSSVYQSGETIIIVGYSEVKELLVNTLYRGVNAIAEQYPNNVKVEVISDEDEVSVSES